MRSEDVWDGHPGGLSGGVTVIVAVELEGYDDDVEAKAVLKGSMVQLTPTYRARLTYRFAPKVPLNADDTDGPGDILIPDDYEATVFGGVDENNDVSRIRRYVALRVLHALRDAEGDLKSWRTNPLRDLLENLPPDPANLTATATAMQATIDQLGSDPSVVSLQAAIAARLSAMAGQRLPLDPSLGFASSRPDELVRAVRLYVDAARTRNVGDASLGSANVLYLALLLEALEARRRANAVVTTILAVEEPEAHLHSSLQRRLFRYLLRSEPTLLLTTHSPHIAAVTRLRSFVLLRDSLGGGTVGYTTTGLQIGETQAQDLERYLDVALLEVAVRPLARRVGRDEFDFDTRPPGESPDAQRCAHGPAGVTEDVFEGFGRAVSDNGMLGELVGAGDEHAHPQ